VQACRSAGVTVVSHRRGSIFCSDDPGCNPTGPALARDDSSQFCHKPDRQIVTGSAGGQTCPRQCARAAQRRCATCQAPAMWCTMPRAPGPALPAFHDCSHLTRHSRTRPSAQCGPPACGARLGFRTEPTRFRIPHGYAIIVALTRHVKDAPIGRHIALDRAVGRGRG